MKRILIYLLLLFQLNITFSNPISPSEIIQEDREVAAFSKINLSANAKVYLRQGAKQKLSLKGEKNMLQKITTVVTDGNLKIDYNEQVFMPEQITIYLTVVDLKAITVSGESKISADGLIKSEDLYVQISSSATFNFDVLELKKAKFEVSGSGAMSIDQSSKAENVELSVSGSGNFEGYLLEINTLKVTTSGSGNCFVNATGKMTARIAGSGNINYKGKPKLDVRITASGKLIETE